MKKQLWALALFAALTAFGHDATGKWSGTMEMTRNGESKSTSAFLILKQDGNAITGSVGPNAGKQYAIKAGSIEGNKIKLEVVPEDGPAVVKFDLALDGDRLTGDMSFENDEGAVKGKIDTKREQ
jgi:hypothetical protein